MTADEFYRRRLLFLRLRLEALKAVAHFDGLAGAVGLPPVLRPSDLRGVDDGDQGEGDAAAEVDALLRSMDRNPEAPH